MSSRRDQLFEEQKPIRASFTFDKAVADVFDDMVSRSVPFYEELQKCVVELTWAFAAPGSAVYDLGCSTGTTLKLLAEAITDPTIRLIGYDNSEAMLEQASMKLATCRDQVDLRLRNIDPDVPLTDASVVLSNWTLQFIRPIQREALVRHIYESLQKGGCVLLCEKVVAEDSMLARLYVDLYHEFKRRRGYSDNEIARKREALENVLIPYRIDENLLMLKEAGFTLCDVYFRWYNWAAFIAIKR